MPHVKALFSMISDPHSLFAGFGVMVAISPEFMETATIGIKLITASGGFIVVLLTGYHKWIQIKKEKK